MPINQLPLDGGMLYKETDMAQLFPEPLNAITAILFLAIAIFWTVKIKSSFKEYPFLAYCLVLLYIGAIGGTVYHAFRQWPVFIMMDWMPIMLLCFSAGFYFLAQSIKWYYAVVMVLVYLVLTLGLRNWILVDNPSLFINVNYGIMASFVLFSVLSYLIYTQWKAGKWVGFALLSFALALTFRIVDKWDWFSFGTHFLWHTFGAAATFCMFNYIYLTRNTIRKI
jgi:hemolysin III